MPKTNRIVSYLANPVRWNFEFEMLFLFEIDVGAIALKLPRNKFPMEIRPGIGLVGIGVHRGAPGNLGHLPAFHEISTQIVVEPDLSRGMPTPRLSFVVANVVSECREFVDHAHRVDKMPVTHLPSLMAEIDPDSRAAECRDDSGPILSMKSTHRTKPIYKQTPLWGQHISSHEEGSYIGAWSFKGSLFEHQQGFRAATIHPHRIFKGIDVTGLGDRCYLQMTSEPHSPIEVTLYEPVLLGSIGR